MYEDNDYDKWPETLSKVYMDICKKSAHWEPDTEEELVTKTVAPKVDHAKLLREVMHELHKQGDGLDTLISLKNDELRDWWSTELAKIKRAEAKAIAREKAKELFSEEERKLLGLRF